MRRPATPDLTRRSLLAAGLTAGAAGTLVAGARPAVAGAPAIRKPLPPQWFVDFGTNAEMRWDSVDPRRYLTPQSRLFVRNHTETPTIDRSTYRLRVFGDGLEERRTEAQAVELSLADLRRLPTVRHLTVHECTGNGRSSFDTQQGAEASGTAWTLGAVGAVVWEGVRLRDVLRRVGLASSAASVQATGLDAPYATGGVDYGRVRRPFPVDKALDDAILAWGANGEALLPDHGYPLRLVLPGWVGIASIKWLGSLEVSRRQLTSPWNTRWYRLTGGDYPADTAPLTRNPVRSALELPWDAQVPGRRPVTLTGRSWSGAAPIAKVDVSVDGGDTWRRAELDRAGHRGGRAHDVEGFGWTQWSYRWSRPAPGTTEILARATDAVGRRQPLVTPFNDNGYLFDAVVRHPVTVG